MKGARGYLAYGLLVMGLLGVAEWRGWSFLALSERRTPSAAPRTVRDNPGAYRPTYGGPGRYTGGK